MSKKSLLSTTQDRNTLSDCMMALQHEPPGNSTITPRSASAPNWSYFRLALYRLDRHVRAMQVVPALVLQHALE